MADIVNMKNGPVHTRQARSYYFCISDVCQSPFSSSTRRRSVHDGSDSVSSLYLMSVKVLFHRARDAGPYMTAVILFLR